jgi:NhaA family Na+:H+ antiporter
LRQPLERIIHLENISGIALILAAAVAIVLANSPAGDSVDHFWHTRLEVSAGSISIDETLGHWVNDGLMTVFFLVAGLEIKREMVTGDLREPRKAALPVVGALGGMIVPAVLYLAVSGAEGRSGWGIPMATDIAFAVGVLTLLGNRVPSPLKVFLLTLAIADDLGAIVVIAVFYTSSLDLAALALAGAGLAVIVVLRWAGVWWIPVYVLLGTGVWLATFESGVHATLAGVACGLLAPARPHRPSSTEVLATPDSTLHELQEILFDARETVSVADRLIHSLHPWTALFIIPVFALANAGVAMSGGALGEAATSPISQGIVVGLVVGKPVGIAAASWLAVRLRLAQLPDRVSWRQLVGVAALGGIGFTVSLFITELAFDSETVIAEAKVGVLFASTLASVIGTAMLITSAGPGASGPGPITYEELDQTQPGRLLAGAGSTDSQPVG